MLIFEDSVNIIKYILLELFWLKFFRCENIEFKFMLIILWPWKVTYFLGGISGLNLSFRI